MTCSCISLNRQSSLGFGSWNSLLTLCRCCMTIPIHVNILLGILMRMINSYFIIMGTRYSIYTLMLLLINMLRNNIINNIHFGDMPNIYKFSSTSQSRISFTIIKYLFSKIVNLIKSKIFNFAIIWVNNNILFYIIRFYNNNKTNYPKLVYIERYIVFV